MVQEEAVWSGTPSQVVNLGAFIMWGLFFWLVFPLFIILWKWLEVKSIKYELTNQRLRTRHGVFNKKMDDLELYRVKDYRVVQPFFLRLFSLGNVALATSDKSHPTVIIKAVPNAEQLKDTIRAHVEPLRESKGVREVDFE
jgi:uncharacterized membrane protein YdbT with pleckstrin-like domain